MKETAMRFADPIFLAVAAGAAALLVGLLLTVARARRRALVQIASPRLLPELTASLSRRRRRFRESAVVAGVVLIGVALARPQIGYRWEEAHRRGVDILFAIDTSKSMLTRDVKPDRLERAKLAVRSLVERFPGDRVGLVAFAGTAFIETPLTLDHGIFDESVASLDTHVIPAPGTDIASAIDQADKALSGDGHRKVLVLITDGEDLAGNAIDAAQRAAKDGVVIYALGVGTANGELIPEPGPHGQTQFVRDENGALVTSRLDETLLGKIALATGGDYRPLGDGGQGLDSLYEDELSKLPKSDLASRSVRVPLERFQWPLAAGLLLLGVEPLVSERRRRRSAPRDSGLARRPLPSTESARKAAAAGALAVFLVTPAAWASPQSAARAYAKGDFAGAEQQYAEAERRVPADPRLTFDLGTAAYRKGDYKRADAAFESALRSEDLGLQGRAYYDLGDSSFRLGEATLAGNDVEATKDHWRRSIDAYEGALRLRRDDADAQFNLDLVKRRLAALEKKQQDQKQQDQKQQDQKQQDQKKGAGSEKQRPQGNGQNPQDQKQNGAQSQNPKQGPGQAPQDARQNGPQGHQPPGLDGPRQEEAAPGELSKADAESLLDSLRSELKQAMRGLPVDVKRTPPPELRRRDW
jgi:Ca-activated chloride channel family protein